MSMRSNLSTQVLRDLLTLLVGILDLIREAVVRLGDVPKVDTHHDRAESDVILAQIVSIRGIHHNTIQH